MSDTGAINPKWTVLAPYANTLVNTGCKLGLEREQILSAAGINEAQLQCAENRLPMTALLQMFKHIAQAADCPDIGLEFGRSSSIGSFGILGFICECCSSFLEVFEAFMPIRRSLMHSGSTAIIHQGDLTQLTWTPLTPAFDEERYLVDAIFSGWIYNGRKVTQSHFFPAQVQLTYPEPRSKKALEAVFGEQLLFNQPINRVSFTHEDINRPLIHSNPQLQKSFVLQAEQNLKGMEDSLWISARTQRELIKQLSSGECSIKTVADKLHMTERTLQRHLAKENTRFNLLLKDVRHNLSLHYLRDSQFPITDIALLLGYRENSAFTHAFRSWTNLSPAEYRKQRD